MSAAKKKMPAIDVPQDDAAADAILKTYGETANALTRLATAMNDEIADLKAEFEKQAGPLRENLQLMEKQLAAFAAAHRDRLTDKNKTKTVKMGAGEIGWRNDPPSVKWKSGFKVELIVSNIRGMIADLREAEEAEEIERRAKLTTFLRVKAEPNKEAMLANPDLAKEVPGVRIVAGEEQFFLAPIGLELAETKP